MGIIWIVIGLIYILYQALKEDSFLTLATILTAAVIAIPGALIGYLRYLAESTGENEESLFALSIIIAVAWIGFLIYNFATPVKEPSEKQKEKMRKGHESALELWSAKMRSAGYDLSPEYMLKAYHNKLRYRKHSPFQCYIGISEDRKLELRKMSQEQLADIIGIDLKNYHEPLPKQRFHVNDKVRESYLHPYDCNRRNALTARIMVDEGLDPAGIFAGGVFITLHSVYYQDISKQIDEELKQKSAQ